MFPKSVWRQRCGPGMHVRARPNKFHSGQFRRHTPHRNLWGTRSIKVTNPDSHNVSDTMSTIDTLDKLLNTLPEYNVQPLWTVMDAVVRTPSHLVPDADLKVPPVPNPKAIPHLWKYNEIRPLLLCISLRFLALMSSRRQVRIGS